MAWISDEIAYIYDHASLPRWFFLACLVMWLGSLVWSSYELYKVSKFATEAMTLTQHNIRWQIFMLFVFTNVLQVVIALCYLTVQKPWPREVFDIIGIAFLVIDTLVAGIELKLVSFWIRIFLPHYVVVWRALRWVMYFIFLVFFVACATLRLLTHNSLLMPVAGAVLGLTCSLMHTAFGAFLLATIDRYNFLTWAPTRASMIKVIRVVCAGTVIYFLRGIMDMLFAFDPVTFGFVAGQPIIHLIQYCPIPQWLIMYSFGIWALSQQAERKGLLATG
eukprot:TRINITY_DN22244_c0_g1_i1.p1 TRINITY_DN22244_c0_g1~~TRINITY_DN22244_c0_g1_i1.p1  ORF type:complete len:277 (-),score=27.49 TRINITY_DN22244_c0_g1_i1:63-893(-)